MKRLDHSDKRVRPPNHSVGEVMTCLIIGACAGRPTQKGAIAFCEHHIDQLRQYLPLPHGVPSRSTVCRVLKMVDDEDFAFLFNEWATTLIHTTNTVIVSDGKGARASAKKNQSERTPYVLNAIEEASKLVVNVLPVGEKENEKVVFHSMLDMINVSGSYIYADAMATDQNIMNHIIDREGNFVFQVKKNNPLMYDQLLTGFDLLQTEYALSLKEPSVALTMDSALESYSHYYSHERNGGRHEHRECWATNDAESMIGQSTHVCGLVRTTGWVEQVRILEVIDDNGNDITPSRKEFIANGSPRQPRPTAGDRSSDPIQRVGVIASTVMNAQELLNRKRSYWNIENGMHYILDNTLQEDRYHYHVNRFSMAVIRRFAYNVLRLMNTRECPKDSVSGTAELFCDVFEYVPKYIFSGIQVVA